MTNPITDNARKVSAMASEKIGAASEQVKEGAHAARERAEAAYATGRARAAEALETSKVKARKAYAGAQKGAKTAKAKTAEQVQDNPLAFLVGGIALGALVGSLLPRTERETKTLGATGKKLNKGASAAAKAAKNAGQKKLDALGINADSAKSQLNQLVSAVVTAVEEAGSAAGKSVGGAGKKR
ncbi:hypothetical protein [Sphingomonas sp. LaA6.9]|uniref:hypothetical protein n=1 Tax=Sphingomonas sp. LaA6.9 TaxID=2919914 RepID=UPI001F4F575F|nr:hypothetical protein [Sphingomonas sp. LaA6.9]MCJ8156185.1 hypothetical protein [Sphingomonas sp. LaA6.9]